MATSTGFVSGLKTTHPHTPLLGCLPQGHDNKWSCRRIQAVPLIFLLVFVVSPLAHSYSTILDFLLTDYQKVVVLGNLGLAYGLVDGQVASFNVAVKATTLEFLADLCRVGVEAFCDRNHDGLMVYNGTDLRRSIRH